MALPVTITGISTAVAPVGPFQSSVATASPLAISGSDTNSSDIGTSGAPRRGYTFTTETGGGIVTSISLRLLKISAPTDNVVIDIFAVDGSGFPTGTSLGTSSQISGSSITLSFATYTFTFASAVILAASTKYALVFSRTGSLDSVNYFRTSTSPFGYTGGNLLLQNSSLVWSNSALQDVNCTINGCIDPITTVNNYYFFGRDGTTATTLQAFKATAPDTSWASGATKTGFTTAILKLDAYQVGNVVHLLVQDGTASTALATKYVSFNMANDTFLATTETVSAAVAVTGQVAGVGAGASLVVRSNGNVVAFYNGVQVKISSTFRAHVYYRERTGVNTWGTETVVNSTVTAVDNVLPVAILGASNRVHFVWAAAVNVANRTLSAANGLNTATTSASLTNPGDGVSYDRSGTTKVVVTSNTTGQTVQRFDSSDNPTASYSTPTAANATLPHRIGTFPNTDDVTIVYRNSADSDLYSIKSSDDGATFGTAVSFFVGTVASADANVSRSSSGSVYARGGNNVVGYLVNDGGTLKYNENIVTSTTNYTDTITPSALDIVGQSITGVYVGSIAYSDTISASGVPIGGSTIAAVYTANYADTITPSSVPIGGATLADDVFASRDTITAGAVPIVGVALADVFAHSDTLAAGSMPIVGAALADVLAFADTIGAGAVPIVGQAIAPVYTANYTDTLTAGALPLVGQAITPVFSAGSINYTDTIGASAVPIGGSTIAPVYTANYSDTLAAGAVPIGGQTIAAVYTARYSDTLTTGGVPLVGQAITAIYTANYSDTLTAGSVPVVGATIAPVYTARYSDTLTAGSVPIVGSTVTPVYTARYTDTLTASALPVNGQAITPAWSAGAVNYSDVIAPSGVPIGGATLVPAYVAHYTDTITPGSLPIGGLAVAPVYTAHYADALAASTVPLIGQTMVPVFTVGALPAGDTFVKVGGAWKPAITYVKDAGAWKAPVTYVKHSGIWTQL